MSKETPVSTVQANSVQANSVPSTFNESLETVDPEIAAVLEQELGRQRDYLDPLRRRTPCLIPPPLCSPTTQ